MGEKSAESETKDAENLQTVAFTYLTYVSRLRQYSLGI